MAKPLGAKSLLIREAINKHPDKGNTAIAELLNDSADRMDDKLKITANDVAAQKQALKKAGDAAPAQPEKAPRKAANKPAVAVTSASPRKPSPSAAATHSVAGHVEAIKKAVEELAAPR